MSFEFGFYGEEEKILSKFNLIAQENETKKIKSISKEGSPTNVYDISYAKTLPTTLNSFEKLNQTNLLKTRYKDGKLYNETDLKVIRNKVEIN